MAKDQRQETGPASPPGRTGRRIRPATGGTSRRGEATSPGEPADGGRRGALPPVDGGPGVQPRHDRAVDGTIHLERSVVIRAPVGRVFAYVERPEHQVQITPGLTEVWEVRRPAHPGLSARYTYRLAGVELRGRVRTTEYRPGRRLALALGGRVRGQVQWTFEAAREGTRLTYALTCTLPAPLLRGVAESYLRAYAEREMESTLTHLRSRLEQASVSLPRSAEEAPSPGVARRPDASSLEELERRIKPRRARPSSGAPTMKP